MIFTSSKFHLNIMVLPGALISGLTIYFIFSYLFIPIKITIPISFIISLLVFGLTKYYAVVKGSNSSSLLSDTTTSNGDDDYDDNKSTNGSNIDNKKSSHMHCPITNILFVVGYVIAG